MLHGTYLLYVHCKLYIVHLYYYRLILVYCIIIIGIYCLPTFIICIILYTPLRNYL